MTDKVSRATDKIESKRKFCRLNESFTQVEITIKAKDNLNDVKYIEYMPKDCIDDLNKYLESLVIPPYYKIKADPLLMWHFDGLNKGKEKTITYILKLELSDYCKELITGMGIASSPFNDAPYLSKMFNDTVLLVGYSVTMNLSEYFKDPDTEHLNYRIDTFRPNPYVISDAETLYDTQNVTLTGGEPFLSPNFDAIIEEILIQKPNSLRTISTNGVLKEKILRFLRKYRKYFPNLSLSISFDGVSTHDLQRGESKNKI